MDKKVDNEGGYVGHGVSSMFQSMDMFMSPVPGFNINGRSHVKTMTGGITSFLIIYITFLYATLKFTHLISKHNPSVNSYLRQNALDYDDVFDL